MALVLMNSWMLSGKQVLVPIECSSALGCALVSLSVEDDMLLLVISSAGVTVITCVWAVFYRRLCRLKFSV